MKSTDNKKTEFVYYPHFIETINIFSNSIVKINDHTFCVKKRKNSNSIILTATKTKFRTAIVKDEYDIIGIQFFPLAINNFFDKNTFSKIENGLYNINYQDLSRITLIGSIEDRINELELLFIKIFKNGQLDLLNSIIQLIHTTKGNIKMNDLENQIGLSRRTILRQFKKYLHCSFEEYKNTLRFRLAIENWSSQNQNTSNIIGDIAYYDQSDFINHFKALSGESPKKLLNRITNNPESLKYFWKVK
ncbi:helix-turn-helix domain-containing protein [Dokdonia pacifica]|nr:helix-turn-helix domain-containing protein [Dokdonia pacifica]